MMYPAKILAATLAAASLLAACGGGAGEPAPLAPMSAVTSLPNARSAYELSRSGGSWTVIERSTGTSYALSGASVKFSDVTVNLQVADQSATLPSSDLQTLTELYVAFFNRVPDADGLAYWIGEVAAGRSIDAIADAFYAAAIQYSSITGYASTMSNEDFVRVIYKNVLGRSGATAPPDADVAYWAGELAAGRATKGSLVRTMLASAHSFKGNAQWGWVADLLDNKITVARTFAIDYGLNYNSPSESITRTMAIAAAVTSSSTSAAIQLIASIINNPNTPRTGMATYVDAPIPGFEFASTNVVDLVATNQGLYLKFSADAGDKILKLHGSPLFNRWYTASFPGGVSSYAPANVYSERADEVAFYYKGYGTPAKWGSHVANSSSTPGFEVEDDVQIRKVVAGGTSGIFAPRPWVVALGKGKYNGDYQYLWQDDGAYTSVFKASDYFGQAAGTEAMANLESAEMLAHPSDGTLFVGYGNKLYVFDASGPKSVATLPSSTASISNMIWHDNELWFALGSKIYRRKSDGSVALFTQISGTAGMLSDMTAYPGRFCINGGHVIAIDGVATRISDGATKTWMSNGELTAAQQAEVMINLASLSGDGVYCSANNLSSGIYSFKQFDGKIRMYFGLH